VTAAAGGRPEQAAAILAARGLATDDWVRALCDVQPVPGAPQPDWVVAALELLDLAAGWAPDTPAPTLGEAVGEGLPDWVDPNQPWQFHAGFAGWRARAGDLVDDWCEDAGAALGRPARADLTWWLVRRLLAVSGPTLMAAGAATVAPAQWWTTIWCEHPVLARLMARTWLQWQDACAELVAHLGADLPGIAGTAHVCRIRVGAGDQHAGGRSVAALTLDDGQVWFAKPYQDVVGPTLGHLLAQLDSVGSPLGLQLPVTHHRGDWTWSALVRPGPCPDPGAVRTWYYRAGALLAVLSAVGATDCHHENLIATSAGPVLVDLETALGPALPDADPVSARTARSPAATSMITSMIDGRPGQPSIDIGGLASPGTRNTPYPVTQLARGPRPGTARVAQAPVLVATGTSLPRLAGHPVGVAEHVQQVRAGFLEVCRRLAVPAVADLLCPPPPGSRTQPAGVRFVARPTQVYARLLAAAGAGECLRDGVARELVLERLWLAVGQSDPGLIQAEQDALRDLDVPRFVVPLTSSEVIIAPDGRPIPHRFAASPLAHARARIADLVATGLGAAEPDLLAALFAADPRPHRRIDTSADPGSADPLSILTQTVLLGRDGPNWVGLEYDPSRWRWALGRLGPGLAGVAGIGLALVLVGPGSGGPGGPDSSAATLGRQALLACSERIRARPGWTCQDGATGVSGVLWALARAGTHLDDGELVSRAIHLLPPALAAARDAAAGAIPCGFTLDPVAAAALAALALPASRMREQALDEVGELLNRPLPPARRPPRDASASWASSFPSARSGRTLARAELGLGVPPGNPGDEHPSWGDAVVLAHLGRLEEATWATLRDRAGTAHDHLQLAIVAATAATASTWPTAAQPGDRAGLWAGRASQAQAVLRANHDRTGCWFGDPSVPDTDNLSAIHGMAALAILGLGGRPDSHRTAQIRHIQPPANVRILR
jgi:hypothetical protein